MNKFIWILITGFIFFFMADTALAHPVAVTGGEYPGQNQVVLTGGGHHGHFGFRFGHRHGGFHFRKHFRPHHRPFLHSPFRRHYYSPFGHPYGGYRPFRHYYVPRPWYGGYNYYAPRYENYYDRYWDQRRHESHEHHEHHDGYGRHD